MSLGAKVLIFGNKIILPVGLEAYKSYQTSFFIIKNVPWSQNCKSYTTREILRKMLKNRVIFSKFEVS